MSLDVRLLEKVRELGNGIVQARCPACAEGGADRAGEHLRVYPDGRFGCCVHPKDREHRKRIFALAGDKAPRSFSVRVASVVPTPAPPKSVASSLAGFSRTVRTAVPDPFSTSQNPEQDFRTGRTPISDSRACAKTEENGDIHICKDSENGVLSVLYPPEEKQMPYLLPSGNLFIPFNCPPKYRWWAGGQSYGETLHELRRKSYGRSQQFPNERSF